MTPRELVIKTLRFEAPPRLPRQVWLLPWAKNRFPQEAAALAERFPDDIVTAPPAYAIPLPVDGDRYAVGTYVDEWGCRFENVAEGIIGEVKRPLLADWSRLDDVRIPVERLGVDVEKVNTFCRATDRFVIAAAVPRPFERLQFLRGSENVFYDLIDQPPALRTLLGRIHDFYLRELDVWAGTDVDAVQMMDDWGGQRSMLVSPELWRAMFKPLYREYVDLAHGRGKYFFMHSDGYILDIMPDLAELGVDAINAQVFCMGPERLGELCAGKITFWGEMDRQALLARGSIDDIRHGVQRMRSALERRGGLIAQCEFGPGAKPENVWAFFEACGGG
ncbi:MAG: uroporphyrinogen decarboxylase family protein [Planctomycetota bacterium]|nr:uroporphyrinogen decarboxylase family protein [Planctomycetota bacterium]